jgi:ubiquinone/menaquinone biosynthesis C-methylase UbiE
MARHTTLVYNAPMERIPEPEIMDGVEQSDAYANADFADVNQSFVDRFVATFPDLSAGHVLDLGCGPADIPMRLCRALPNITVTAVDGSPAMLSMAKTALSDSNLSGRVQLKTSYIPVSADTLTPHTFDAIISNSLLHHMNDPLDFWAEIARMGRTGAPVLVVDLMRPDTREAAHHIVETVSPDDPQVLKTDFFNSLLAAYRPGEVTAHLSATDLSHLSVNVISDRHIAVWGHL